MAPSLIWGPILIKLQSSTSKYTIPNSIKPKTAIKGEVPLMAVFLFSRKVRL